MSIAAAAFAIRLIEAALPKSRSSIIPVARVAATDASARPRDLVGIADTENVRMNVDELFKPETEHGPPGEQEEEDGALK